MRFNPDIHRRRSVRLKRWDYASRGAYFVTVCAHGRECVFGEVRSGRVVLNGADKIVESAWNDLPLHYPRVELDVFVVMPNHVHGILIIGRGLSVGARHASPLRKMPRGPKRGSVGAIVGSFKSAATRRVNTLRKTPGLPLWQRNYYEHIIRGEAEINRAREYVLHNPLKWLEDENHPENAMNRP